MLFFKKLFQKSLFLFAMGSIGGIDGGVYFLTQDAKAMENETVKEKDNLSPKRNLEDLNANDSPLQKKLKHEKMSQDIIVWKSKHHQIATSFYNQSQNNHLFLIIALYMDSLAIREGDTHSMCRMAKYYLKLADEFDENNDQRDEELIDHEIFFRKSACNLYLMAIKAKHSKAIGYLIKLLRSLEEENVIKPIDCISDGIIDMEPFIRDLVLIDGNSKTILNEGLEHIADSSCVDIDNFYEALPLLKFAGKHGCGSAFFEIGNAYLSSFSDQKLALRYFQKGARLGCLNSTFHIAQMYKEGAEGLEQSKNLSFSMYLNLYLNSFYEDDTFLDLNSFYFKEEVLETLVDFFKYDDPVDFFKIMRNEITAIFQKISQDKTLFLQSAHVIPFNSCQFHKNSRMPKNIFFSIVKNLSNKDVASLMLTERSLASILSSNMTHRKHIYEIYKTKVIEPMKFLYTEAEEELENLKILETLKIYGTYDIVQNDVRLFFDNL